MKKYISIFVLAFGFVALSNAVVVTLPHRDIIMRRLHELYLYGYTEGTNICHMLGEKKLEALEIACLVEQSLTVYTALDTNIAQNTNTILFPRGQLDNNYRASLMVQNKIREWLPRILTKLLQDSPDAIEELKRHGKL